MRPLVADFYEVQPDDLQRLRDAAAARPGFVGRRKERCVDAVKALRRPVPSYESEGFYLAAVAGYLGDEGIDDQPPAHAAMLKRLGELQGGHWLLYEPTVETITTLDPARFNERDLRSYYAGEPDAECLHPHAGAAMLAGIALLRRALDSIDGSSLLLVHQRW